MAHKLGAFHHLPHGVANAAILIENVMRYNAAEVPTKMGTFSQYPVSTCYLQRYAEFGRFCRMSQEKNDEEVFENFLAKLSKY